MQFGSNVILGQIKPMLVLFVAAVVASLYTVFDKTLWGLLSTKENVAFYECAILRHEYEDYMQLPPEKDRIGHHFFKAYQKAD